jgi:hypothetical protein
MAFDQDKSPRTLEVLRIGDISVSDGIAAIPLRVHVHGAAEPEGDIVITLVAPLVEELSGRLQSSASRALRQWKGKA